MGSNGSFARGDANTEEGRMYKCIAVLADNIKVLMPKASNHGVKLPEESHTPNAVYVSFHNRKAKAGQLKAIASYGDNGLKKYEIHTADHYGLGVHCHYWHDGRPDTVGKKTDAKPLTDDMIELYNNILKLL